VRNLFGEDVYLREEEVS
jgi:hypothetical protein